MKPSYVHRDTETLPHYCTVNNTVDTYPQANNVRVWLQLRAINNMFLGRKEKLNCRDQLYIYNCEYKSTVYRVVVQIKLWLCG